MTQADDVVIANEFKVTWHDCIYDLTKQSCKVDIQNLNPSVARDFNLSALISNTNYDLNSFDNSMAIKEWKALSMTIPTYANQTLSENRQNATNSYYYGGNDASAISIQLSDIAVSEGNTYIYDIIVNNSGTEIAGMQSNILFNSSELQINSITEGNLLKGAWSTFFNSGTIYNSVGNVTNIYTSIIGAHSTSAVGTFITINATALKSGFATISLNNPKISLINGTYAPFSVAQIETYNSSYIQQYQNGTTLKNIAQWKPTKSNMLKNGTNAKMFYGTINLPKYNSKEKYDDFNTTETFNGTKYFLVEWNTPITKTSNGYGSSGKIAFWDEATNTEYHPWWNTSWSYVRPITVTNTSVLSDYQVNILINSTYIPNLNWSNNGSDVRFTYNDNTTVLSYWIESWNNVTSPNNASVWVKTNQSLVNMWYGNPSVTTTSNASNVMELYDDFSGTTLNSKWINSTNSFVVSGGFLNITSTSYDRYKVILPAISGNVGYFAKTRFIMPAANNNAQYYMLFENNTNQWQYGIANCRSGGCSTHEKVKDSSWSVVGTSAWSKVWLLNETINLTSGTISLVNEGDYSDNYFSTDTLKSSDFINGVNFSLFTNTVSGTMLIKYDYVIIRKYITPEPTLSIGAEQSNGGGGDTTPPILTITSPINNTNYSTASIWFNATLDETGNWSGYSLDGMNNISLSNTSNNWNFNNGSVTQGLHWVIFYANDSSGNIGISGNYTFRVDSIAPIVSITTPASDNIWYSTVPSVIASCTDTNFVNMTGSGAYVATKTVTPATWTNSSELNQGSNSVTITCTDMSGNTGNAVRTLNFDNVLPLISNITYSTSGGFTTSPLQYLQIINFIRVNATDTALQSVNISVYDPDGAVVSNQLMSNETVPYFNYTSSITLNKAGTWSINISDNDTVGNVNSISTTFSVTTANTTLVDNWYGFSNRTILTSAEISTLAGYGYNIYEFEDNTSNINNSWSNLKTQINNSYNQNVKVGINYLMDYNYTNTTQETAVLVNITNNFADLTSAPYGSTVMYISFEPINQSRYTDTQIYTTLNKLAKNATSAVSNKFVIYAKNYNSSGLDSSYIQKTTLIYVNDTTETSLINTEASLLRNNASYNRIYAQINDTLKSTAKNMHDNVIKVLRSTRTATTISDQKVAEQANGDIIVFNNQSTEQLFVINASGSSKSGKDAWDSTNKYLIEQNTDLNFTVNVSAYGAAIIYFDDIDHIVHNSPSYVATAAVPNVGYFNYTDGTRDGSWALSGASDIQMELFDPNYVDNGTFITYYGWLNASTMSYPEMCLRNPIIIADKNTAEVKQLIGNCTSSEVYGYISVADFANTDAWNTAFNTQVDNWLAVNESMNIFVDGLDSGILAATNFTSRMKDAIDYIQITKGKKAILNTYTAYETFATWGTGGIMKESCVNRWNGALAATPDNYTRENWTLELQRASWFQSHNVKVLCQAFYNRSTDNGFTIKNYTELENIYFASKVLGYDYFYLSQPDFNYIHLEKVYDVGTKLANSYSTDDNETYYRKYSKGIVYYNTSSKDGWIADNRQINNITVCFDGYVTVPYTTSISFRIGDDNSGAQNTGQYTISGVTGAVWTTYCKSGINQTDGGRYLINAWSGVHTDIVGQGVNLGWSEVIGNGQHSWYDTSAGGNSWTVYDKTRNWEINLSINDSYSATLDSTTFVSQNTSNTSSYTNLTLSSTKDFNMTIWSSAITVANVQNITYLSGSNWITVNYANNTDCDSNTPTWNTTTIAGETHKACIKQSGSGYKVRVATPHLSTQTYKITEQGDITPPEITIQSPTNTTYNTNSIWFNITGSETLNWAGYSLDNAANISLTNSSGNWNGINYSVPVGAHTVVFSANDTNGNMNSTNRTFTIDRNISVYSFSLNDTYINFNQSILLSINASSGADFAIELQTSSGLRNATIAEEYNSTSGNYTLLINATDLGNQSANATRINITNIYTLLGNFSAQVNSTGLYFNYGTTNLTGISYSPKDTHNDTSITVSMKYLDSENANITSACYITQGGSTYTTVYASGLHTGTIPTSALNGEYVLGVTCNNSAYQAQTNSSVGFFIVRVGQASAGDYIGGSTNGNSPSGTYNALQNLTNTSNTTDIQNTTNATTKITLPVMNIFFKDNSTLPSLNITYVNFSLGKQLTDYSAPAFGWIAPKTINGHELYVPNWAVALLFASMIYAGMGGLKSNSAFQDKVMVVLLPIVVFVVSLYFLVVVV